MATQLIQLELPRLFQPQDSFDLAEEIRGHASSVMIGSAFAQTTDGRAITYGGGLVPGPTGQGWAYVGDGTDNIAYATPVRPFVFGTDKDFTFIVVCRKNTAGANGTYIAGFGSAGGSSGNTRFILQVPTGGANAVYLDATDAAGAVFLGTASSAFGFDDTNWHTIIVKGRVAHASSDGGGATYFADGKRLNAVAGLTDATPSATTFNVISACSMRRGGSNVGPGPYDVALFLPLIGVQMPDDWCRRASHLDSVWGMCFEPWHIWVPVQSGVTSHATEGALASDAAVIAGTATHLTLHTTEGALASDAAVIAGTADHATGGEHPTEGALASDAAAIAGTAAHYTLHTTTGALASDAATIAGAAAHLTLHATSGALQAESASMAGTAVHSGAGAVQPGMQAAGRPSKDRRRPRVVEIDGEDFVVSSAEEAQALLDQAKAQAQELAALAVSRAAEAKRRPPHKVIKDARRLLETPAISAPEEYQPLVAQTQADIRAIYQSALATVEIAALLAKRQREEEDDEDVLLLIA